MDERISEGQFWAAPGLPEKRSDLTFDYTLDQNTTEMWPDKIQKHQHWACPMSMSMYFLTKSRPSSF